MAWSIVWPRPEYIPGVYFGLLHRGSLAKELRPRTLRETTHCMRSFNHQFQLIRTLRHLWTLPMPGCTVRLILLSTLTRI